MGLNVVAATAVLVGRILDTMGGASSLTKRIGLSIVSGGCLIASIFAVTTLIIQLRTISNEY
ncbi:hypothetical protein HK096_008682, partial [Nowakowskiella sp. JEL0078]